MKSLNPIPSITIIDNKETINVASLQGRKKPKKKEGKRSKKMLKEKKPTEKERKRERIKRNKPIKV